MLYRFNNMLNSNSREVGRPKSIEDLKKQVNEAQNTIGADEASLIPASVSAGKILKMQPEELRQKYAKRYEMYVRLLRHQTDDLSQSEVQKMKRWLIALNSLDLYLSRNRDDEESVLREKQKNVFEDLCKFIEAGGMEGYVKLPTGVGKTVLFSKFVEALGLQTLIVVPTAVLVDQTIDKLGQFTKDLDLGKVFAESKEFGHQVTVITYDSLLRQVATGNIDPQKYECVILDEAHVSLSPLRMETVKKFEEALVLGFTATPQYSDEKGVGKLLEKEIHSMSIVEAIRERLLASVSARKVNTEVDISNVEVLSDGDFNERDLERVVNTEARNKAAIELYQKEFSGELALAYCAGIRHAEELSAQFRKMGVTSAHISGKMSPKQQAELLQAFSRGDIKVLCNADLLIAGFDEPKASVCLNLRPTLSRVVAEQRAGRCLRLDPEKPNKLAKVIDFLDKASERLNPVLFADVIDEEFKRTGIKQGYLEKIPRGGERESVTEVEIDSDSITFSTADEELVRIVQQPAQQEIKRKEEGWYSRGEMADILKADWEIINRTLDEIIDENKLPVKDNYKVSRTKSGRKIDCFSAEFFLEVKRRIEEFRKIPVAPIDWFTANGIANKISKDWNLDSVNEQRIRSIANKLKKEMETKDDIGKFRISNAGVYEHYSPKVIKMIVDKFLEEITVPDAPKDWISRSALGEKLGIGATTINARIAEASLSKDEKHMGPHLDPAGKKALFLSPALAIEITNIVKGVEEKPEDWYTIGALSKELGGIVESRVKKKMAFFDPKNEQVKPKKFRGQTYPCIPAELAKKIREDIKREDSLPTPPENWLPLQALAKVVGFSVPGVLKKINDLVKSEDYKDEHKICKAKTGFFEYYSPKILEAIQKDIMGRKPKAKEGWSTNTALCKRLGVGNKQRIKKMAEKYRGAHPEWFDFFTDLAGGESAYYHPQLIAKIEEEVNQESQSI